jgi:hypothetical protein
VTIRITAVGEGKTRTLRVDGRLVGDDVAEVVRACGDLKEPVVLDLGGLRFADGRAVSVLRDLQARGVTLLGASPYIRLLLGRPATEEESR